MKFKSTFMGYDKQEVDAYLLELERKHDDTLRAQKERIFQLVDENKTLNDQVVQYKIDEQAISKTLIESQKVAKELTGDAENFARITLNRAKIFYATWQAYSKTLLSSLSNDEVKQFNVLSKKIEDIINAYEGKNVAATVAMVEMEQYFEDQKEEFSETCDTLPSLKTMSQSIDGELKNPMEIMANASGAVIEMREILTSESSLEELCLDLGLIKK